MIPFARLVLTVLVMLLPAATAHAASIESCLNGCDAGYYDCRQDMKPKYCYDSRNTCIDRCDAQRNNPLTLRHRLLTIEDLEEAKRPKTKAPPVTCESRCDDQARTCTRTNPDYQWCSAGRQSCLQRCPKK